MGKVVDMTGWVMSEHGVPDSRLTVIERAEDYIEISTMTHRDQWLCKCSCGNIVKVIGKSLRSGKTKSCGCLRKDIARENVEKIRDKAAKGASEKNKKYNQVKLNLEDQYGLYGIGYCYNTGNEFYFDMDDYDKIKDICWNERNNHGLHVLQGRDLITNKMVRMHSYLGYINYDHEDRNELNNRKYNLRPATPQENARNHSRGRNNTSGFIGVSWNKQTLQWRADIVVNKKQIHLGLFNDKEDAIKARLQAEYDIFKEFAPQKHLFKEYGIGGEPE